MKYAMRIGAKLEKYYHSFKVGDRLVIKPSWEDYQAQDGKVIIEIDPGMAFGTGIHALHGFVCILLTNISKVEKQLLMRVVVQVFYLLLLPSWGPECIFNGY